MLVSLLFASALLAPNPTIAAPAAKADALITRGGAKRDGVLTWVEPLHCKTTMSLAAEQGSRGKTASPTWTPKDFPDAGWYHTVAREVAGCQVATPMSLQNGGK